MSINRETVNELWFIRTVAYHAAVKRINSIYYMKRTLHVLLSEKQDDNMQNDPALNIFKKMLL